MEKITTLSNKSKEEDISIEELHQENKLNHDVADTLIFDAKPLEKVASRFEDLTNNSKIGTRRERRRKDELEV